MRGHGHPIDDVVPRVQNGDAGAQPTRGRLTVAVGEGDVLGLTREDAVHPSVHGTGAGATQHADRTPCVALTFRLLSRTVPGPIVDDHDLEVRERLSRQRVKGTAQENPTVSDGDDDGDAGGAHH
jgi:hypothetical protein